jgi:flagellar assembly protein FliH
LAKVIKAGSARILEASKPKPKAAASAAGEPGQEPAAVDAQNIEAELRAAYEDLVAAAQDEVSNLLGDARMEATALIRAAETQAGEIRANALRDGRQEGLEQAAQEAEALLRDGRRQIDDLLRQGDAAYKRMMDEVEPQVFRLSMEIARKVLGYELDRDDKAFLGMLRAAMESVKADKKVNLRVNSADFTRFFNERGVTLNTSSGSVEASVAIDPLVEPYGLLIDTDSGTIDASLNAQLDQIQTTVNG